MNNKTKALWIACAVSALAFNPVAFAQPGQIQGQDRSPGDQRRQAQQEREQNRDADRRHGGPSRNDGPGRGDDRRDDRRGDRRNDSNGHRGRGAGPDHNFYIGNRLPPTYHQRRYVVDDWRRHQLRAPPRGYHWVQNGGDYLLVAITTGVILQLILSN